MSTVSPPTTVNRARSSSTRLLVVSMSLAGGGAERFTANLLNHLNLDLFNSQLCVVRPDFTYPLRDEIPVISLDKFRAADLPRTIVRLRRLIRTFQPQVVLSTITFCNRLVAMALPNSPERPRWIARIGCNYQRFMSPSGRIATRLLYSRADGFVANSQGAADAFSAAFPRFQERISVISNPTDFASLDGLTTAQSAASSSEPIVVTAGRLERVKRHDLLLRAFAMVRRTTKAKLWICGDGPLKFELQQQASHLGISDDIRWLGFVDNPYAVMKSASIFAMSSDSEGMPNALIEAQGLGLPAVSVDCDFGPREIIEANSTGFLTPQGDCAKLAGAMHRLITDAPLRESMGRAAADRARTLFSLSANLPKWQDVLDSECVSSISPVRPETQAA